MKHTGSMNLWGNEPLRTFGICGAEVVLRVGIICVILEHQIYLKPGDVSVEQWMLQETVWLAVAVVLAVCFSVLCAKRGWYTQNSTRFLNIENAFFALPFLILLCCSAYSDAWDVCIGLLIAGGLCVPRVIGCIAYYNNCKPEEHHIAQWGVMIAGMLMSWIMIIAIAFWVAMPPSFWNVGNSEFIWTGKEVALRVVVPLLVAMIRLGLEVRWKRNHVLQKSEWTVLFIQDLYCIIWSGIALFIMGFQNRIRVLLILWALLCIVAQRIASGRICNHIDQRSKQPEYPQE